MDTSFEGTMRCPLAINYSKLLFMEKSLLILDFAKTKFGERRSQNFKVFQAIAQQTSVNVTCSLTSQVFMNVGHFSFKDVKSACEALKFKICEDDLASVLSDLMYDPGVKFLK